MKVWLNLRKISNGYSIKHRIAFALFVLVAVQGLVFLCSVMLSGTMRKNDIIAYEALENQANSRRNELQTVLNTKRINITNISIELGEKIEVLLAKKGLTLSELASDNEAYDAVLAIILEELITFTKYNSVTGVFAVFDESPDYMDIDKTQRNCMYLRDSSPGIITGINSNLLLEYGRVDIARQRGIAVNYLWTRDISFSDSFYRDFYFKPVTEASSGEADASKPHIYGYWSRPFTLKKDDIVIITYSLPLILSDGTVCGVLGFELETNYLSSLIPAPEIPYDNGFYLLGFNKGSGFLSENIVSSGPYAYKFLSGPIFTLSQTRLHEDSSAAVYEFKNPNYPNERTVGALCLISLYESFSPFYGEQWALICAAPKTTVLAGSNSIKKSIAASIASTMVLALLLSLLAVSYIFKPIKMLYKKVGSIDPEKPVRFEQSRIREIDELAGAFEVLSDSISEAAAKMFKIIELVDMPLGSFEINYRNNSVLLSSSLFRLLDIRLPDDGSFIIASKKWNQLLATMTEERKTELKGEGISETLYSLERIGYEKKWFKMRKTSENMRDIGVLIDVTEEILQKQHLEFERNYDSLTNLFNRQGFFEKAFEQMKRFSDKTGLVMFADLDDLKFVNDSFGHETGDDYIRAFSGFLTRFENIGAVVGRISGDEFVMFIPGFNSREEAQAAFYTMFSERRNLSIVTPDDSVYKLRVSVGLSFYPYDSDDIKLLVKYADYAMYEIKHSNKGEIKEFNIGSYKKNAFTLNMKNILNLFLEEKRVHFAFQPIVDARTGEVYAYEALMRSMMQEMKSIDDILKVARAQAKLYQVEKLTFDVIFDWISKNTGKIEGKKMFVNTMPSQKLTDNDMDAISSQFGHLFERVVFEFTEDEFSGQKEVKEKIDMFRSFGSKIAIDDYGAGYSNEMALLIIVPDFLKIDMNIVRNIDKDEDKRQLAVNIIEYAARRGIKTIAEGVETLEELETVIQIGTDYIQGFYLGKPNFEILDISEEAKDAIIRSYKNKLI